jgi:hypothetical protein
VDNFATYLGLSARKHSANQQNENISKLKSRFSRLIDDIPHELSTTYPQVIHITLFLKKPIKLRNKEGSFLSYPHKTRLSITLLY